MKLLTKEIENRFARLGCQEDRGEEAIVVTKLFTPDSSWTWFCLEFDPETREFFGLVEGHEIELGYFSLEELESVTGPLGLHIERDLYWRECPLREVRSMLAKRRAS